MEIFKNKFLVKLIATVCLFLTLFNFSGISKVYADDDLGWGGVLILPITDLLTAIGDSIMELLHKSIQSQGASIIAINGDSEGGTFLKGLLTVVALVILAVVAVVTMGWALAVVVGVVLTVTGAGKMLYDSTGKLVSSIGVQAGWIKGDLYLPAFSFSPEELFSNKILLFDINFFNPKKDAAPETVYNSETGEYETVQLFSTARKLRDIVATWYFILRNIALLILMLILIYIGIKIVIGSTAGEKAKYKERLMDWLVAMCLLFIMHYMMAFSITLVEKLTTLIGNDNHGNMAVITLTKTQFENAGGNTSDGKSFSDDSLLTDFINRGLAQWEKEPSGDDNKYGYLMWQTDLAGMYRIQAQLSGEGTGKYVGYCFAYIVLIFMTLFFAFTYLKRVIYMAFLTMIAPLVAMTYPIDKITDGKAQAFDSWMKEYIFNLMIQPLHLLLYTVLVSSAWALASESPLYALVALGFMMPAEKLMRRFFGFEKAHTPGLLGGAAGAALAFTGMQSLLRHKPHGGENPGGGNSKQENDKQKIRFTNKNDMDVMGAVAGGAPISGQQKNQQPSQAKTSQQGNNSPKDNQQTDPVMEKYGAEGFDQNSKGEYYNPYTDEYDPNYDPHKDASYNATDKKTDSVMEKYGAEGFDQNSKGEYYNPYTDEYDPNYDPHKDASYSGTKQQGEGEKQDNSSQQQGDADEQEQRGQIPFNEQPSDNNEKARKSPGIFRRTARAGGAFIKSYAKSYGQRAFKGSGRKLKKAISATAMGTLAGSAGLLMGVASGDPNKAFQYTTTGAVAGGALGSSIASKSHPYAKDAFNKAKQEFQGDEYKAKQIAKDRKAFIKNEDNINYLSQTLQVDRGEAKKLAEDIGGRCHDKGITDIKDVATIADLTRGEGALTFDQAVAARHYATKRLPPNTNVENMDPKLAARYKQKWAEEFREKGYANANEAADNAFELVKRYNKTQSNLEKL